MLSERVEAPYSTAVLVAPASRRLSRGHLALARENRKLCPKRLLVRQRFLQMTIYPTIGAPRRRLTALSEVTGE